ncbi:MAG: hypothetical protein RL220_1162, partial [Bacteroidota bacterium]
KVKNTKPSADLAAYAGTYRSDMYGDIEVSVRQEGGLDIRFIPTELFRGNLEHYHYDTFLLRWSTSMMLPPGKVNFILDQSGSVSEMRIDVPNPDFDFTELKLFRVK